MLNVERSVFFALVSGRRGSHEGSQICKGWVAQLAEQWTENLVFAPLDTFARLYGCEHARPEKNKKDRGMVNMASTPPRVRERVRASLTYHL